MKDLCIEEVTNVVKRFQEVCQDRIHEILNTNDPQAKAKVTDEIIHEYMNPARQFDLGFT
jgi:hypothetical protein